MSEECSAGVSCYSWRDDEEDVRVHQHKAPRQVEEPKIAHQPEAARPRRGRCDAMRCEVLGECHVDTSLTWVSTGPPCLEGCCSAEMDKEGRVCLA